MKGEKSVMKDFYGMLKEFVLGLDSSAKNVYKVLDEIFKFWAE